jgi:hypothetical protein
MLTTLVLLACTGTQPAFKGTQMEEYFPLDGERRAAYGSFEGGNGYDLVVTKVLPTESADGVEIVTFEHSNEETGEILGAVKWSNSEGVQIHGYRPDASSDFVTFDTPVIFATEYMMRNDAVTTETNGFTFTSTLVGFEDCPVLWGQSWTDCAHVRLDDGDGDDASGPLFAGDYWLVTRYGPAWMTTTGVVENWNLKDYDWTPEGG